MLKRSRKARRSSSESFFCWCATICPSPPLPRPKPLTVFARITVGCPLWLIEALQVAVDDENEVVESLAHRHGECAHRLRLVHLTVAEEGPHLLIRGLHQPAMLQVTREARLEDRHHGTQAHRHRRELPEIRHQPRVRIGRQALTRAAGLLAKVPQPLLIEA